MTKQQIEAQIAQNNRHIEMVKNQMGNERKALERKILMIEHNIKFFVEENIKLTADLEAINAKAAVTTSTTE
jgi:hypothetical protein